MPLLEYKKWENFNNVIKKSVISYRISNNNDLYWLPEVRKPIISGKGKEEFIARRFTSTRKKSKRIRKTGDIVIE